MRRSLLLVICILLSISLLGCEDNSAQGTRDKGIGRSCVDCGAPAVCMGGTGYVQATGRQEILYLCARCQDERSANTPDVVIRPSIWEF